MKVEFKVTGQAGPAKAVTFLAIIPALIVFGVTSMVVLPRLLRGSLDVVSVLIGGVVLTFLAVFGLGGWLIFQKARLLQALKIANPQEPWLWKPEWAGGRIVQTCPPPVLLLCLGLIGAVWTVACTALVYPSVRTGLAQGEAVFTLLLLLPVAGLVLLGASIYMGLRHRKYGKAVFQMADLPAYVGEDLGGVLEIPVRLDTQEVVCRVVCVRRVVTGTGDDEKANETELWGAAQTIPASAFQYEGGRTLIPLIIGLEGASMPCDDTNPRNRILWRLTAKAKTPGIDFSAVFDVPVFARTNRPS